MLSFVPLYFFSCFYCYCQLNVKKNTVALIAHVKKIFQRYMCMTFQLNKTPFLALELPRFLTFDMDQLAKHRRHHLTKRLKISKIANFESDTFSASEDIALQVAKFYRRLYGGGGGGGKVCTTTTTTTIPTSVKLHSFEEPYLRYFWQQITLKLGNRINLEALFSTELTNCP